MRYIDKEYVENTDKRYNEGNEISRRKAIYYNGIQGTLNKNVYYVLNHREKIEWAKCYSNIEYFIETYLNIKLRTYQKEWVKLYSENRFSIYNVARQTGYISIMSAIMLHDMIFNNKKILLVQYKLSNAVEIIDKITFYYLSIPYFLKPNLFNKSQKNIKFNNSEISISSVSNIISTNYDVYQYLDAADNFHFEKQFADIIPKLATVSDNKVILTSTPNGQNNYYKLWKNSQLPEDHPEKNAFKTINTYWYEVDNRDLKWKEDEIKRIGLDSFNKNHELLF